MNIFETATKQNLTFASCRGRLTVSDLWQVDLLARSSDKFCLDEIAKTAYVELEESGTKSFVKVDRKNAKAQLRMDIIKHIIASKQEDIEKAKSRVITNSRRDVLLEAKAKKVIDSTAEMSAEDIDKELAELDK